MKTDFLWYLCKNLIALYNDKIIKKFPEIFLEDLYLIS